MMLSFLSFFWLKYRKEKGRGQSEDKYKTKTVWESLKETAYTCTSINKLEFIYKGKISPLKQDIIFKFKICEQNKTMIF